MKPLLLTGLAGALLALATAAGATPYPLTITSCNRQVVYEHAPQRAVSHDISLTAMMVALGLQDRMVGYTGISGWKKVDQALFDALGELPELSRKYPSVETLLGVDADFYFAGWNYGMHVGGDVTPASLAPLGIQVYELTESCGHVTQRSAASLEDLFVDLDNLGRIFNVQARSDALVSALRSRLVTAQQRLASVRATPRVFLYDSGEDRPFTAGRQGMPNALIEASGGRNLMDDVDNNWTQVNWEAVVERNPEVILIVDYGEKTWEQKRDFLLQSPALQSIEAIKRRNFIVLTYLEVTPSVQNLDAVEKLAAHLHPASATPQASAP